MREKKAQESILAEEYKLSVDYLRQFLPDDNYLDYICFDMAKLNKTLVELLIAELENICNLNIFTLFLGTKVM